MLVFFFFWVGGKGSGEGGREGGGGDQAAGGWGIGGGDGKLEYSMETKSALPHIYILHSLPHRPPAYPPMTLLA